MSFEILCRGVLGVAAGISAAIIKGAIFGGPPRSTLAGVRGGNCNNYGLWYLPYLMIRI